MTVCCQEALAARKPNETTEQVLERASLEARPDHPDARPGLEVRVCTVCQRRHFRLTADPGVLGVRGGRMG